MENPCIKNDGFNRYLLQLRINDVRVLLHLAENGPASQFEIHKRAGVDYSSVHDAVKRLEKAGLVRMAEERLNEKRVKSKIYRLTLIGLCRALDTQKLWDKVDTVLEKWEHLEPMLFGKWKSWTGKPLREEALYALKHAVDFFRNVPVNLALTEWARPNGQELSITEDFRIKFFGYLFGQLHFLFPPATKFSVNEWMKVICNDAEVNELVLKFLQKERYSLETELGWIDHLQIDLEEAKKEYSNRMGRVSKKAE
jgi:DNA-binding MarR family transcriptional regulator